MRFKIGDKVKIRTWDDMENEFGLNHDGSIACAHWFTKWMAKYCGKYMTVKSFGETNGGEYYKLVGDNGVVSAFAFSDDMLVAEDRDGKNEDTTYSSIDTSWIQDMVSEFTKGGDGM